MRRKSERNKLRSPEKKVEKPSRRTRRRRGTPESDEDHPSENEAPQTSQEEVKPQPEVIAKNPSTDSKESNSNSDEEAKEQSVWQVKSAETPSDTGEIQKLKICLQRPSSSERSPRKHHGSSQESADSSEDVRKKRSKKHYHSQEEPSEVKKVKLEITTPEKDHVDNAQEEKSDEEPIIDKKVTKIDISAIKTETVLNNDEEQPSSDNANVSTKEPEPKNDENAQVSFKTEPEEKMNIPVEATKDSHGDKGEDVVKVEQVEVVKVEKTAGKVDEETEDKVVKETKDKVDKATSDKIVKETEDKVDKETKDKVDKETSNKIDKETQNKVDKETLDKIAQETAEQVAQETAEQVVKETVEEVTKETVEEVAKETMKEAAKEKADQEKVPEKEEEVKISETVSETVGEDPQNGKATPEEDSSNTPAEKPSVVAENKVEHNSKASKIQEMETEQIKKSVETPKPRRTSRFDSRIPEKPEKSDKTEVLDKTESCDNTDKNGRTLEHSNSIESTSGNTETEKVTRKRRWGSKRTVSTDKRPVVAISTDSLKNLISDVKPLSVNDVQLEVRNDKTRPEHDKIEEKTEEIKDNNMDTDKLDQSEKDYEADDPPSDHASNHSIEIEKKKPRSTKTDTDRNDRSDHGRSRRKLSVNENVPVKQSASQPKHKPSEVLYITHLVRPFTVLQLKGLLARTGKLAENGFWIDNIKSKCFVRYENEDQAVETRHALHGTRWPSSNPKLLQVEFSTVEEMEKCVSSVPPPAPTDNTVRRTIDSDRVAMAWLAEQNFKDERNRGRDALRDKKQTVREWDMGKQDPSVQESLEKYPRDNAVEYPRDAVNRERRDERYDGRDKRRSRSRSPVRRFKRKDEEAPAKRLDDLFRKTKVTPCIYWLPLTPEQISVKEEMRRQHMAEHERRKEEIRKQERERDRERHLHREKQNSSNRDRDRRRNTSLHNSRSRDRNIH